MRRAPQTRLNAPKHDRHGGLKHAANEVGVDHARAVRSLGVFASRGVVVIVSELFARRVVGNHGVHTAPTHAPKQARFPKACDVLFVHGLGDDTHLKPRTL